MVGKSGFSSILHSLSHVSLLNGYASNLNIVKKSFSFGFGSFRIGHQSERDDTHFRFFTEQELIIVRDVSTFGNPRPILGKPRLNHELLDFVRIRTLEPHPLRQVAIPNVLKVPEIGKEPFSKNDVHVRGKIVSLLRVQFLFCFWECADALLRR